MFYFFCKNTNFCWFQLPRLLNQNFGLYLPIKRTRVFAQKLTDTEDEAY